MQLRYFLLLLVAFAASCSASTVETSLLTVQGRSLRGYQANDEERALSLSRMSVEKLENILTNTEGKQLAKFAKWQTKDVLPLEVTQAIRKFSPQDERYWAIGIMYGNYLKGIKPTTHYTRLDDIELVKLSQKIANSKLVSESIPSPTWSELFGSLSEALRKKAANYFQPTRM
ncbi:hypothetical protein V7S43_016939 [Phytophthora oleae]|uniref:RxLR effector protein n=1 Tax=Phytophthora oleae TaxID=2107226 RepID=A0ABD3EV82_9STRA